MSATSPSLWQRTAVRLSDSTVERVNVCRSSGCSPGLSKPLRRERWVAARSTRKPSLPKCRPLCVENALPNARASPSALRRIPGGSALLSSESRSMRLTTSVVRNRVPLGYRIASARRSWAKEAELASCSESRDSRFARKPVTPHACRTPPTVPDHSSKLPIGRSGPCGRPTLSQCRTACSRRGRLASTHASGLGCTNPAGSRSKGRALWAELDQVHTPREFVRKLNVIARQSGSRSLWERLHTARAQNAILPVWAGKKPREGARIQRTLHVIKHNDRRTGQELRGQHFPHLLVPMTVRRVRKTAHVCGLPRDDESRNRSKQSFARPRRSAADDGHRHGARD